MAAIIFEEKNILPNVARYTDKFNLNLEHLLQLNKDKVKATCNKIYNVYWWSDIIKRTKAASYALVIYEISQLLVINNQHASIMRSTWRIPSLCVPIGYGTILIKLKYVKYQ